MREPAGLVCCCCSASRSHAQLLLPRLHRSARHANRRRPRRVFTGRRRRRLGTAARCRSTGEVVSGNFFEVLGIRLRRAAALTVADDDSADARRPSSSPTHSGATASARRHRQDQTMSAQLGRPLTSSSASRRRGSPACRWGRRRILGAPRALVAALTVTISGAPDNVVADGRGPVPKRTWRRSRPRRARRDSAAHTGGVAACRAGRAADPARRGDSMLSEPLASPIRSSMVAGAIVLLVACLNVANLQLARPKRGGSSCGACGLGARQASSCGSYSRRLPDGRCGRRCRRRPRRARQRSRRSAHRALWPAGHARHSRSTARVIGARAAAVRSPPPWSSVFSRRGRCSRATRLPVPCAGRAGRRPSPLAPARARRRASGALDGAADRRVAARCGRSTACAMPILGFDAGGLVVLQISPEWHICPRRRSATYFDEAIRAARRCPASERRACARDAARFRRLAHHHRDLPATRRHLRRGHGDQLRSDFTWLFPDARLSHSARAARLTIADRDGQPERIIVNETMARRFWPEGRAVGGRALRRGIRSTSKSSAWSPTRTTGWCARSQSDRSTSRWPSGGRPTACSTCASPASRRPGSRICGVRWQPSTPRCRRHGAHTVIDQIERNVADERMAMAIGLTLGGGCARAGHRRAVRDHGVPGRPPDARDRRAHGARRGDGDVRSARR